MLGTNNDIYIRDSEVIKPKNNLIFVCGNKEMLRFEENGDIFVKGDLIENDKDVVEGLRDFLRGHKYCL